MLLLDKPSGPTSNRVLGPVRRWANTRRVGHTGTLDPLASGLLPVVVGKATRAARFLPAEPKEYEATVRFGITTDTADADGHITAEQTPGETAPAYWEEVVAHHCGEITLPVPLYAAVKLAGKPLYKYARAGSAVDAPLRPMKVYSLKTNTARWPDVDLRLVCGSGTYVRAIALSLGAACGCGAHVTALRRTRIAHWHVASAVRPTELPHFGEPPRGWIPLRAALNLKTLMVSALQSARIRDGRRPEAILDANTANLEAGEPFLFTDLTGEPLAVARCSAAWSSPPEPPDFSFERVLVQNA